MKVWNFGILGPGRIASKFADAFALIPEARIQSVGSRDTNRAKNFARRYSIPKIHSSYEALIADPEVDVIYIATPHSFHCEQSLACLRSGKAVVCEKPLAINKRQVIQITDAARQGGVFFMEGMWSRFFPFVHELLNRIKAGAIGQVKDVEADFGFRAPVNHSSRVYDLRLGGGAHLDVGVYPQFLALLLLGKPSMIISRSTLASTGADETTEATLHYDNGAVAKIYSSIVNDTPKVATIKGTEGMITIASPWYKSNSMTVTPKNGFPRHFDFPVQSTGFEYQIREVVRCLAQGLRESDQMPHSFSLMMAEVSDEIRKQGRVVYPEDAGESVIRY